MSLPQVVGRRLETSSLVSRKEGIGGGILRLSRNSSTGWLTGAIARRTDRGKGLENPVRDVWGGREDTQSKWPVDPVAPAGGRNAILERIPGNGFTSFDASHPYRDEAPDFGQDFRRRRGGATPTGTGTECEGGPEGSLPKQGMVEVDCLRPRALLSPVPGGGDMLHNHVFPMVVPASFE